MPAFTIWYFGAAVILFPSFAFNLAGMELPRYPQIWQSVGMVVGVYGIGYLIAARDPYRHWPIVLVGLAGKILGPIGFVFAAAQGEFPWSWGTVILFSDLIWWIPFGLSRSKCSKPSAKNISTRISRSVLTYSNPTA
ncbi:MAG: small multidrug resistance pump [Pirellulaceae bacterium]